MNQWIKNNEAKEIVFNDEKKGLDLKAKKSMKENDFIIEYVGLARLYNIIIIKLTKSK